MTIQDNDEFKKKPNLDDTDTSFTADEPEDVLGFQLKEETDNEYKDSFQKNTETDKKNAVPETVLGFDLTESAYDDNGENSYDVFLKLELIEQQLNNLSLEIQSKLNNDEHKDNIIDTLHQELQAYKNDLINKDFVSIVSDLIKFIDDTRKITTHYRASSASQLDPQKLLEIIESIPSDIEDIFSCYGIKTYSVEGITFDSSRQQALKKIETQDKSKDRTVAERYRLGYRLKDKIVRPEIVDVYIYDDANSVKPNTGSGSSSG